MKKCALVSALCAGTLVLNACTTDDDAISKSQTSSDTPSYSLSTGPFDSSLDSLIGNITSGSSPELDVFPEDIALSENTLGELNNALYSIEEKESSVGFVMIDIATGLGVSYHPDTEFYGASAIKGPYVVAINKFLPDDVSESDTILMHNAIDISDNDSYVDLRNRYGDDVFAIFADNVNATNIDRHEYYPNMTSRDLAALWLAIYDYFYTHTNELTDETQSYFTAPYNSFIHQAFDQKYSTYSKPGWISTSDYTAFNDAGIVESDDGTYVLAVMSTAFDETDILVDLISVLDKVHQELVTSVAS